MYSPRLFRIVAGAKAQGTAEILAAYSGQGDEAGEGRHPGTFKVVECVIGKGAGELARPICPEIHVR